MRCRHVFLRFDTFILLIPFSSDVFVSTSLPETFNCKIEVTISQNLNRHYDSGLYTTHSLYCSPSLTVILTSNQPKYRLVIFDKLIHHLSTHKILILESICAPLQAKVALDIFSFQKNKKKIK